LQPCAGFSVFSINNSYLRGAGIEVVIVSLYSALYSEAMRKILLIVLMLLVALPGMACAMPLCHGTGKTPCPHHHQDKDGHHGPMLMGDCAHMDLLAAGHTAIEKPNPAVIPCDRQAESVRLAALDSPIAQVIRGPPPDWPRSSKTQPSLLLTTQRFRE
jgi:hypothetical protein